MPRNPAATRQRLLDAAFAEFAAHGLAGARVERIVEAAGVNKRMLYHYFGNKEGLFRHVLRLSLDEMAAVQEELPPALGDILAYWSEALVDDSQWFRLLHWQALETEPGDIDDLDARHATWLPAVEQIRKRQAAGEVDPELDPAQLLLSCLAIVFFPIAFPQLTRMITGHDPASPGFRTRRVDFLRQLAKTLTPNVAE